MTISQFLSLPWASASVHPAYEAGVLHMRPAPEYASGEVVLASTYRAVGFSGVPVSEGSVPARGREFYAAVEKGQRSSKADSPSGMDPQTWRIIIESTLRSPKLPSQSNRRFMQLSPLVPDAALYSLSARLSTNSWNPGQLVSLLLQLGESSSADEAALWSNLFHAMSVGTEDDPWARFLQAEFEAWRGDELANAWMPCDPRRREPWIDAWHRSRVPSPATSLVRDLQVVLALKRQLTRRQWVSMLESILRIGTAAHVLWVCALNIVTRNLLIAAIRGEQTPTADQVALAMSQAAMYWRYGQAAGRAIQQYATGFAKSRVFINLLLWQAQEDLGESFAPESLSSPMAVSSLLNTIAENGERFRRDTFTARYQQVVDAFPREVAGKVGIASNVSEFLQHVLRQRATNEKGLESYDQGYYLAKSGPLWRVAMGPVSVLTLVHATTAKKTGPSTVADLCDHAARYGIEIEAQNVPASTLGQTLRNLGLVLDSPDAEGGMVLVDPFAKSQTVNSDG